MPSPQLNPGKLGYLSGVDGRFLGCLHKYYGNLLLEDLDTVLGATLQNISFFRYVSVQKGTTSGELRGFVVRYGATTSDQVVTFFRYDTALSTWGYKAIYSGSNSIDEGDAMDCVANGKLLLVCIEGQTAQTYYWDNADPSVETVAAMGGDETVPAAPTAGGSGSAAGGYLKGTGIYQFAYRFYSTTRGIYTALSSALRVEMAETDDLENYVYHINPAARGAAYDTVQYFRTINQDKYDVAQAGVFYLEASETSESNDYEMGSLPDSALVMQDMYSPESDEMIAVPTSGAIGKWDTLTMMARDPDTRNGVDTIWSDPATLSPEYFTDYNLYRGHLETGKPGVDLKVRGVIGFAYQAWGLLHNAGTNHVHLDEAIEAERLEAMIGDQTRWTIYEYGVGDDVSFDREAVWSAAADARQE